MPHDKGLFFSGRGTLLSLMFAAGLLLLHGCAGKPDKPPPMLDIDITASEDLNPGPNGQPLPVVLRLYQLKQSRGFMGADFYSLFDKEVSVLGPDLVSREEITLRPGQWLHLQRQLDPAATSAGVLAAYRAIDQSHWRADVALIPGKNNGIRIVVTAEAVSAALK